MDTSFNLGYDTPLPDGPDFVVCSYPCEPFQISESHVRPISWKLNDNLLKDSLCKGELAQSSKHLIADHATDSTSLPLQWEALKCVLRGISVNHGARLLSWQSYMSGWQTWPNSIKRIFLLSCMYRLRILDNKSGI